MNHKQLIDNMRKGMNQAHAGRKNGAAARSRNSVKPFIPDTPDRETGIRTPEQIQRHETRCRMDELDRAREDARIDDYYGDLED